MASFLDALLTPVAHKDKCLCGHLRLHHIWRKFGVTKLQRDSVTSKTQHLCLLSWIWTTLTVLARGSASANENTNCLLRWHRMSDTSTWGQMIWHETCSLPCPEGLTAVGQQESPASISHSTGWLCLGGNYISIHRCGSLDAYLTCRHLTQTPKCRYLNFKLNPLLLCPLSSLRFLLQHILINILPRILKIKGRQVASMPGYSLFAAPYLGVGWEWPRNVTSNIIE